jgi:hypothetical protein
VSGDGGLMPLSVHPRSAERLSSEAVSDAAEAEPAPALGSGISSAPRWGWRAVEVLSLASLVFALPLLDIYGNNPAELLERNVVGLRVLVFGAGVLLVPVAVVMALEAVAARVDARLAEGIHRGALSLLVGLAVVLTVPVGPVSGWLALVLGPCAGVGFWFAWARFDATATWVRHLAVLPVILVAVFVFRPGISRLAFSSSSPDPAASPTETPASVLFMILDELPTASLLDEEGKIDAGRFPGLATLAADATWYRNNVTAASWTSLSVPLIATGQYPDSPDALAYSALYPENVFALFGGSHRIERIETATRLCPVSLCGGGSGLLSSELDMAVAAAGLWFDKAWPFDDPEISFEELDGAGVGRVDAAAATRELVQRLAAAEDPTFVYLHLPLPHQTWLLTPSGGVYDGSAHPGGDGVWDSAGSAASARQQHLLQLQHADAIVAETIATLREAGRYDHMAIVVVSDHGVSFEVGVHDRAISESNLADIAYTPLIVKAPGQTEAFIDERPTQTIDAVPTVAAAAGIEIPWATDGVDLATAGDLDGRVRRYFPVWIDRLSPTDGAAFGLDLDDAVTDLGLPTDDDPRAVYAVGSDHLLVGTPVTDLRHGEDTEARVSLDVSEGLGSVDLTSPERPVRVIVKSAAPLDGDVAIALNGVVAATGALEQTDDEWRLQVVLDERLLVEGANAVAAYLVSGEPGDAALAELSTELE